jgi:uncharacterized protein (DUF342 family)
MYGTVGGDKMNSETENAEQLPVIHSYAVIILAEKNTEAIIEVIAPKNGGDDVTEEMLRAALEKAGVCYGIRENVLLDIVEQKIYGRERCIAEYTPPENGENGTITYLFDKSVAAVPVEDENGYVDYRELGRIRSITKGTVIANITLPTEGVPGYDVLGREIAPTPTKKAAFSVGVGTVLSYDGLTLSAANDGHLVYEKNAFTVRKALDIKADIDFNTGNIQFLSDINIRGNVGEGFKVISTGGNVTIEGGVFSGALIKAAGNITLRQVANHCTIEAGGNITANFCEYCNIHAGGDITAATLMICDIYCGGTLTTKGTSKGGLVGGTITVLSGVSVANNIGSPNYPSTMISLGDNSVLSAERDKLIMRNKKYENDIIDTSLIIDFLNNKKKTDRSLLPEKEKLLGVSVKKRIMLRREIKSLEEKITDIDNLLTNRQNLRLEVMGSIYPKTKININTVRFETKDEWKRVSVSVDEYDEVHYNPL